MAIAVAVILLAMSVVDTILPWHIQVAKVEVAMVAAVVVEITAPAGTQVTAAP